MKTTQSLLIKCSIIHQLLAHNGQIIRELKEMAK
jgi:hypothetical protein